MDRIAQTAQSDSTTRSSRRLPDDWYTTAARAEHNTHCTPCRESAAAMDAAAAENGASIQRRDRRTLGLFTTRTGVTR
ncbi:hypothetical protein ACWC4D_33470 [Streptomyces sp. NPDC001288]